MKRRALFPALPRRRRPNALATQRVAVVSRMPGPVRALILLLILALGAALGSGLYEYARRVAGFEPVISSSELNQMHAELQRLAADNDRLQSRLSAADGRLAIEQAARDQLTAELRAAQKESGSLRNDLAFFEQLIPADPRLGQVNIRSAEVERQGQTLSYRILLMRAGHPSGEFRGRLQFSASGTSNGSGATIELHPFTATAGMPAGRGGAAVADPLALSFRQYQRVEGTLGIPAGFVARTITVRVLEGGVTRSQSTINLPA